MPKKMTIRQLCKAFVFDWTSAFLASLVISPTVGAIDRAFTANTAGTHTVLQSLRESFKQMLFKPHHFVRKPDMWILVVLYSTTYGSANTYDSWYRRKNNGSKKRSAGQELNKVLGVSLINTGFSIWKDYMFAKICYPGDRSKMKLPKLPLASYIVFFARDTSIIAMAFTVPNLLAYQMNEKFGLDKKKSLTIAQFISPVLAMTWTAPMSVLGLDLYNRKNVGFRSRFQLVKSIYWGATATKMARIIPPYAFGPSTNRYVREKFEQFEETQRHD